MKPVALPYEVAHLFENRHKGQATRRGDRLLVALRHVRNMECRVAHGSEAETPTTPFTRSRVNRRRQPEGLAGFDRGRTSERRERKSPKDKTQAWLLSLGQRLAEVEEGTPECFEK